MAPAEESLAIQRHARPDLRTRITTLWTKTLNSRQMLMIFQTKNYLDSVDRLLDSKLSPTSFGTHNIGRVTEHTVMKATQDVEEETDDPSEALVLQLVAQQTSIPVPQVRSNSLSSGPLYRGLDVYASHSPCTPIFASCAQLGTRVPPFQARPDEGGRICQSPLFGQVIETRGPFETYADLTHFFNDRLVQTLQSEARTLSSQGKPPSPVDSLTTFDDSQPLVLTHQDLNSRNFIVGDDGHLWLVDWAWAGFYPPWFEFVAMRRQAENEELVTRQKNPAWDAMIPFVCGWFFEHEKWLNRMARSLYWI